jgi:hypothetical protein
MPHGPCPHQELHEPARVDEHGFEHQDFEWSTVNDEGETRHVKLKYRVRKTSHAPVTNIDHVRPRDGPWGQPWHHVMSIAAEGCTLEDLVLQSCEALGACRPLIMRTR